MNLPNRLTLARIVLAAFFVMAMLLPHLAYGKTLALVIFVVASLTDWWDGVLARRHKLETNFGALLDPVADKILTTAAFICFIEQHDDHGAPLVQAWMVLLIVSRDFLVTGLRLVARTHGAVIKAEELGKHKTISQMVTIIVVLTGLAARDDWNCLGFNRVRGDAVFSDLVFAMMIATVAMTVWSGTAYLYKNREIFLRDA